MPSSPTLSKAKLLTGGNPQIAKADGDVPVQAYISALSGWKRDTVQDLDRLISRVVFPVFTRPCDGTRLCTESKGKAGLLLCTSLPTT